MCVRVYFSDQAQSWYSRELKEKCDLDSWYVVPLNNTGYFEVWDPPCTLRWSHTNTFFFFLYCCVLHPTVSNISMFSIFLLFCMSVREVHRKREKEERERGLEGYLNFLETMILFLFIPTRLKVRRSWHSPLSGMNKSFVHTCKQSKVLNKCKWNVNFLLIVIADGERITTHLTHKPRTVGLNLIGRPAVLKRRVIS